MRLEHRHLHARDAVAYKGAQQNAYGRFDTVRLAADEALLKRFVFLLAG